MNLDLKNKTYDYLITAAAIVVYFITAFNSHGYYHADEHYQIIEFAGLKTGANSEAGLPWEYQKQIRPALQPAIAFVVLKTLQVFNILDPYSQMFFLRIITAILSLVIITYFINRTEHFFPNRRIKTVYRLLSYFLWFIPLIGVRFSSETWSGLFFLLSIALFYSNTKDSVKYLLTGLALGFSFLFRFQISFAIAGYFLWLLIVNKTKIRYLIYLSLAFLFVILTGVITDSWFYGNFVFTPLKYAVSVFESGGDGFGTSPWYYYFVNLLKLPSCFIGIPLVISFIVLIIYSPRNLLLWCFVPFVLIHTIIPHKEERFIFPLVFLFPFILTMAYTKLISVLKNRILIKLLHIYLSVFFSIANITGIAATMQKSAGIGRMEITRYIHGHYQNKHINLIFTSWANPYNPWHSLPTNFYLEKDISFKHIKSLCNLSDSLIDPQAVNLLVIRKIELNKGNCVQSIKQHHFIFERQSIPVWIEAINDKYQGFDNNNILLLYRYTD